VQKSASCRQTGKTELPQPVKLTTAATASLQCGSAPTHLEGSAPYADMHTCYVCGTIVSAALLLLQNSLLLKPVATPALGCSCPLPTDWQHVLHQQQLPSS
jgi:hypothetical protein